VVLDVIIIIIISSSSRTCKVSLTEAQRGAVDLSESRVKYENVKKGKNPKLY